MTSMVENAIEFVEDNTFDAVFDKGYYTAEEIHKTQKLGVTTHVCIPNPAAIAPDKANNVSDKEQDSYTSPAGQTLQTNANWYQKKAYRVKQHKTKKHKRCPVKKLYTIAKYQKIIERHEFTEAIEINKQNITKNPDLLRKSLFNLYSISNQSHQSLSIFQIKCLPLQKIVEK